MTDIIESGQNISVFGKSGQCYSGKIYNDKNGATPLSGRAIVCLTNSRYEGHEWKHTMHSIYNDDIQKAFNHFKTRDDVSHLILLPQSGAEYNGMDKVDDLIRQYLHG